MKDKLLSSFAVRLRDVLSTLESTALLATSDARVRGLGEQLQFACMALPCEEALVAVELGRLGRLEIPGVASADSWRQVDHELLPSGTPFAYLLRGGGGYAAELVEDDPMLETLRPALECDPRYGLFVPIRLGSNVIGGAALLREADTMGDRELGMAERLADVLALTMEAFHTDRVLLELFAAVLPDLCAPDAPTAFADGLHKYLHGLRLTPDYRRRLDLAGSVARLTARGRAETEMAADIVERVATYVQQLAGGGDSSGDDGTLGLLSDELYE